MKDVQYSRFGGPEVLEIVETPMPEPGNGEVLVQVKAVSINPLDWKIRSGKMKMLSGSKFPKMTGIDVAGIVEKVGEGVNGFSKGDAVFGVVNPMKRGSLAEYLSVPGATLWKKPESLSFAQAAALPVVGTAAYEALFKLGGMSEGSEVLLNGASGGVGMFAIQIAKRAKARTTAVVGPGGVAFAKAWGADTVIDYTKDDVLKLGKTFDIVFDMSGKLPYAQAKSIMKSKSVYINPAPDLPGIIGSPIANLFTGKKNKMLMSNPSHVSIAFLLKAIENGLKIEVSRTFPMAQFREAYQLAEKGGTIGKLAFEV